MIIYATFARFLSVKHLNLVATIQNDAFAHLTTQTFETSIKHVALVESHAAAADDSLHLKLWVGQSQTGSIIEELEWCARFMFLV